METVRLRLVFDHILSKLQNAQGLKRCWILLKPHHQTISDLSSYLLTAFNLQNHCPNGLLLSMEGFALPDFESTSILKDKDVLRVEKNGGVSSEIMFLGDEVNNALDMVEIVETQPAATTAMNLLANEEFEKESGGYQSEEEEDAPEQEEETLPVENTPEVKTVSKKRKATQKLKSSKRKRTKSASAEKQAAVVEDKENDVCGEQNGISSPSKVDERIESGTELFKAKRRKKAKAANAEKQAAVVEDKGNNVCGEQNEISSTSKVDARIESCTALSEAKRRKKTKAASAEKQVAVVEDEGNNSCGDQNGTLSTPKVDEGIDSSKALSEARRFSQPQENGHGTVDASPSTSGTKKLSSRSSRRKQAQRMWKREQVKAERRREQHQRRLHENSNQQSSGKINQQGFQALTEKGHQNDSEEIPEIESEKLQEDNQQLDKDSDLEDEVVPITIRPGHIRFEPLGKVGADQDVQPTQFPLDTFQWNGITSKKKGQKWGKEKATFSKRNAYKNANQECSKMLHVGGRPVSGHVNFEQLEFYTTLPKEGDVIAYRLIELSSSWTPELSSYRVGKISRYDMQSNRVRLVQLPGYPVISKDTDDGASAVQTESTTYAKDGSLWIEFSSLIEVRLVTQVNSSNSVRSVAGGVTEDCVRDRDNGMGLQSNTGHESCVSAQENGKRNAWEEINTALEAKKAELAQVDNWNKVESSGRRPWSYKALRGSALGPTMALLRSQNEI